MSVFKVYVDGELFYHPSISSLAITQAEVTEDASSIDSLKLSAPMDHPYLDSIKPLTSIITLKKDDTLVFRGRALDDGSDFYNTHTWTCESCLAWLKDTYQKPFDYQGPLKTMLQSFLDVHNSQVEDAKKFTLGNVTVEDDNDYIHYASEDYINTMTAISEKLIDTHGGYLVYRYENDTNYLDYLADFSEVSTQTVEYGKNLLDVTITRDHTSRITALIPFGAVTSTSSTVGEADTRLDITSVNDGVNYVYDQDAVDEIGWIWSMETWDDVTVADNLLTKAKKRLAELKYGVTGIDLSIVDESDTGADIGDIHAREYINVISEPHGINGRYQVLSKTTDFLNPSSNTISVGATGVSLTSLNVLDEVQAAPTAVNGRDGADGKDGTDGQDAISLTITSSNGIIFSQAQGTTLTASVHQGKTEVTGDDLSALGTLTWYKDQQTDSAGTGNTLTVSASDIGRQTTYTCKLLDSSSSVLAQGQISLFLVKDIVSFQRYYLLQSSSEAAPAVPTVDDPPVPWSNTEPDYAGTNMTLYYTDLTKYSDGSFSYSDVSQSGSMTGLENLSTALDSTNQDLNSLKDTVRQTSESLTQKADEIQSNVAENYALKTDVSALKSDIQTNITQTATSIRMDFTQITDSISNTVNDNQTNLEEYIRFQDGTIELGKIGNAFSAELSNTELAFMQDGVEIAYISDNAMKITDAEVSYKLSLGHSASGWFDLIPRVTGDLSIKWRDAS